MSSGQTGPARRSCLWLALPRCRRQACRNCQGSLAPRHSSILSEGILSSSDHLIDVLLAPLQAPLPGAAAHAPVACCCFQLPLKCLVINWELLRESELGLS